MLLVTGATGFIGGRLIERVDGPVRCLVRRSVPLSKVTCIQGDLVTAAGLDEALEGVDTIIHLAGAIKGLRPEDYYIGNCRTTENLAKRAAGRGIRFVHVSSLAAAGPSLDGAPLTEDAPPRPVSHYGKSKLEAEQIVRGLLPDAVIIRPPVVYGPGDRGVLQVLKPISRGLQVEIGGGDRWFSAIFVDDLIAGILAASKAPHAAGRTYFLTYPEPFTWAGLAALAGRIMKRRPLRLTIPPALAMGVGWGAEMWAKFTRTPGFISRDKIAEACCERWTCDPGRAARELGFEARMPLAEGLARTLAWYKEAGWIRY